MMLFKELRDKHDRYGAFTHWVTVNHAKRMGLIPDKFFDFFKDDCECGGENIITYSLTQEMCCDPNCIIKTGYRLAKLFENFSIKGVGPATCSMVYKSLLQQNQIKIDRGEEPIFKTNSYIEVLSIPLSEYPMNCRNVAGSNFFSACRMILDKSITFPDLIGKLGLTTLGSNSANLFDGINNFDDLRAEILKYGNVAAFCTSRGSHAPMVSFNVANSLEDIYVASVLFTNIRRTGLEKVEICMTGRITLNGVSITKAEFVNKCNELCKDNNGVQLYEIKNTSAIMSVPYVVYSVESNSAKFQQGKRRGTIIDSFGEHKVLVTADEFYKILGGKMQSWNSTLMEREVQDSQMDSQMNLRMKSELWDMPENQCQKMEEF